MHFFRTYLYLKYNNRIIVHFLSGWQILCTFSQTTKFSILQSKSKHKCTVSHRKVRSLDLNIFSDRIKTSVLKHGFHTSEHEVSNRYQKYYMLEVVFHHNLQLTSFAPRYKTVMTNWQMYNISVVNVKALNNWLSPQMCLIILLSSCESRIFFRSDQVTNSSLGPVYMMKQYVLNAF